MGSRERGAVVVMPGRCGRREMGVIGEAVLADVVGDGLGAGEGAGGGATDAGGGGGGGGAATGAGAGAGTGAGADATDRAGDGGASARDRLETEPALRRSRGESTRLGAAARALAAARRCSAIASIAARWR